MTVTFEGKKVFSTPHATVVVVNGEIKVMKVCRPAHTRKRGSRLTEIEHVAERDITFDTYTEFQNFVRECSEVLAAINKELYES